MRFVIIMDSDLNNNHHGSLFKWLIRKETWILIIQDPVLNLLQILGLVFVGTGCIYMYVHVYTWCCGYGCVVAWVWVLWVWVWVMWVWVCRHTGVCHTMILYTCTHTHTYTHTYTPTRTHTHRGIHSYSLDASTHMRIQMLQCVVAMF